ncbi:MAG: exodeoxyribonuclease VII small subunit [Chlamydiales bacterium]|nr:exodeoxyribonuclease VII small subunit [Chlamydiales bacterium]
MSDQEFNFEKAFARLEAILDRMNSGNVSLDDSLKLYEEADQLIAACGSRLSAVEERIEALIKRRGGELEVDEDGIPQTEAFQPQEVL